MEAAVRLLGLVLLVGCGDVVVDLGGDDRPLPVDPSVEPVARLVEIPVACTNPSAVVPRFQGREAGEAGGGSGWVGGALFAADLDGDRAVDLGVSDATRSTAFLNRGGAMEPDPCFYGFDLSDATAATPIDYDADGDLDLFVARYDRPQVLLRNESELGWLVFSDGTAAAGLDDVGSALVAAWADIDLDGDLDLFTGGHAPNHLTGKVATPRLYENLGGTFTDVSDRLPDALSDGPITAASWFDPDRDGLPDLYVVRGAGSHSGNLLLRNDGRGGLERDHNELGLDVQADGTGLAIGDINGDQTPDLPIAERGGLQLRLSREGWWEEVSYDLGLRPGPGQHDAWGVALGDVDNDGDLDAAISFGPADGTDAVHQPDALFLQGPDGSFADVAPSLGLDSAGVGRGLLLTDIDGDGWLDLARSELDGPSQLHISSCGEGAFLRVELSQPGHNPRGIGTRIRVVHGDQVWTRTVRAGGDGFASAGPPEVHVGLGSLQQVDRVDVIWPDGRTNRFEQVATGQRLLVVRE